MAEVDIAALGARAETMIKALGAISAEPDRLVRLFLTPEHRRAADLVTQWMREAGLTVTEDPLGTVRGRVGEGRRLLIGSHIDTVIDAGHYDGPLGVIAGILAANYFNGQPPIALDVLAFGDEEGSRFPSTLSSSSACVGAFDPAMLRLTDRNGITFAAALKAYGKDCADIGGAAYQAADVRGYIEVHIEQGPLLETEQQPLGVVTGIVGQSRFRVTVTGEAGHAGTVPMRLRRDALAGAAEMTLAVEKIARAADGMVATVGQLNIAPGATNIIPAEAVFSVDLRSMDDAARKAAVGKFEQEARGIAAARGLSVTIEHFLATNAVACDAHLQDVLAAAIGGGGPPGLASGAGHDAQMMARLCPSVMMFVRCKGGVSHNPAEYASPADMGQAIAALIRFIEKLASQ